MRRAWPIWAGAALQIVLFQLIIWAVQAGARSQALWLVAAALLIGAVTYLLYSLTTTEG